MDDLSSRFLAAWNEIDKKVKSIFPGRTADSFAYRVRGAAKSNAAVRQLQYDLLGYTGLRNALVHGHRGDDPPIAQPVEDAVKELEHIRDFLLKPPSLDGAFNLVVSVCSPSDRIAVVAKAMAEDDFSQMPVYRDDRLIGLLTAETIARWFANRIESEGGILDDNTVEEVLPFQEPTSLFEVLSRNTSIFDALDLFDQATRIGRSLDAIIVTPNGKRGERPTGIVTVYDVPTMMKLVR